MPSAAEYFNNRACLYARIYARDGGSWRDWYYRLRWYPLHRYRALIGAEIGAVAGRHVLDLGCGIGVNAVDLAAQGARVVGVDVSSAMLALAQQRAATAQVTDRVEYFESDGLSWLTANRRTFDVALAIGLFDYVDDPRRWLCEIGQHCHRVIATFPCRSPLQAIASWRYRRLKVHARVYRASQLHDWFAAAGFADVRILAPRWGGYVVIALRPEKARRD